MAIHEEVARPELARMVRGRGQFLNDVKLPGMGSDSAGDSEDGYGVTGAAQFSEAG